LNFNWFVYKFGKKKMGNKNLTNSKNEKEELKKNKKFMETEKTDEEKIKFVVQKLEESKYFKGMKILKTEENRKKFAQVLSNSDKLREKYLTYDWESLLKTVFFNI
jgi:hypothetical protein